MKCTNLLGTSSSIAWHKKRSENSSERYFIRVYKTATFSLGHFWTLYLPLDYRIKNWLFSVNLTDKRLKFSGYAVKALKITMSQVPSAQPIYKIFWTLLNFLSKKQGFSARGLWTRPVVLTSTQLTRIQCMAKPLC